MGCSSFDNDPATGDPFIAGCIINPGREKYFVSANDYSYTPYLGVFTLDLGNAHKDMHANCSYWSTQNFSGIADDEVNIYIYKVNDKKLVRTIPHKNGSVKINFFPAKEGHMMVAEYNRKERYTRFSIEALN